MKKKATSYIVLGFIGVLLVVFDQIIKDIVSKNIVYASGEIKVIDKFFSLVNWHNTGAAWGIFSNATFVLTIVSIICVWAIIFVFAQADSLFLRTLLILLASGATGNIIDRVRLGYVVDFLDFYNLFGYQFPAFNIADICVTCGCIMLIIYVLFLSSKYKPFREGTLLSKVKF